jgi:Protein of unknown function (DUF1573)
MRTWPLIILAICFGVAFGVSLTVIELGASLTKSVDASVPTVAPPPSADGPHVVADEEEFNFGSMERDSSKSHVFKISNTGKALLMLKKGESTCRCTRFEIAQTTLLPGESTTVTIQWHATVPPGPFRQSASIETNDPSRTQLTFSISGDVTSSIRVDPDSIFFTAAPLNEPQTLQANIYSYRPGELKVLNYEFMETTTADKFDFRSEPMSAKAVAAEKDAQSGVVLYVTVKPGLPLGSFRQKIKVNLNLNNNSVELPIDGTTVSDIVIAGSNWNDEHSLLTFGTVSQREGAKAELFILAHGPHRNKLHPTVKEVTPDGLKDVLKVHFDEPTDGPNESTIRLPFTVEIPPGTPPMLHLGGQEGKIGEILIDSGDPDVKAIRVRVRFAVGE